MKVVIINTKQRGGGAAKASFELFKALSNNGVNVSYVAAQGDGGENIIILSSNIIRRLIYKLNFITERLVIWINNRLSKRNLFGISIANTGFDLSKIKEVKDADIINIHWINQGMLSVKGIKKLASMEKPIVITTHDMWFCTAICHHAANCDNFKKGCKWCGLLAAPSDNDLAARVWKKKSDAFNCGNFTFVTISPWIKEIFESSSLTSKHRNILIPNCVDVDTFRPTDKYAERAKMGISKDEKVIIFGAAKLNDPIKGAALLFDAIDKSRYKNDILLILFGAIKDDDDFLSSIPCRYKYMGTINNTEELARLYSMADIMAAPSHYETSSLVIAEAMSCGTPAVTFDTAGQCSNITHKKNGFLARYPDTKNFGEGIDWIIDNADEEMRRDAAESIRRRSAPDIIAKEYIKLYEMLLNDGETDE